jgi:hypothetical protein
MPLDESPEPYSAHPELLLAMRDLEWIRLLPADGYGEFSLV